MRRAWSAEAGRRPSGHSGHGASLRTSLGAGVLEAMGRADSTPVCRRGSGGLGRSARNCITPATPSRSRGTRTGRGVASTSAARPTGRTAPPRDACREEGAVLIGLPSRRSPRREADLKRRTSLPSRSSARNEASRSGAKAGVHDGNRPGLGSPDPHGCPRGSSVKTRAYTARTTAKVALIRVRLVGSEGGSYGRIGTRTLVSVIGNL